VVPTGDPVLQGVCAVLVLALPAAMLLVARRPRRRRVLAAGLAGAAAAMASLVGTALVGAGALGPASVLDAAITAALTAVVAIIASTRLRPLGGGVFAALWGVLVLPPVFAAAVGSVPSLVQVVFGAVDYAGVLATHVAPAASLLALSLLSSAPQDEPAPPRPGLARSIAAVLLLTVGASAWMIGVERAVTAATGRTLANAIVGVLIGALVAVLIARIAGRTAGAGWLVVGAVLGWGAIGSGAAFLAPVGAGAAVVIGAASGTAIIARAPASADLLRRGAVAVIVSVAIGGVVLAVLADGFGLAATGATAPVAGQLGAVIAIGLGSALSGALCAALALLAQRLAPHRDSSERLREGE
jgi:ammonia channel protein AmtB